MKTQILSFAVLFGLFGGAFAEEAAKPLVSLSVKRQVLGTEKDDRGPQSESRQKEYTLKVTIKNLSATTLEDAELTGDVLIERAVNDNEKMVKEALKSLKLPPMKPNENLTVDLGKIILNEHQWRSRTFEEKLEEWKVVCKKGETNIGENVSSANYEALVKKMQAEREAVKEEDDDKPIRLIDKNRIRKLRDREK